MCTILIVQMYAYQMYKKIVSSIFVPTFCLIPPLVVFRLNNILNLVCYGDPCCACSVIHAAPHVKSTSTNI